MGYGVRDNEVFDHLLEEQLNAQQTPDQPRLEFLNFATGRSYALHRRLVLEQKALDFEPDAVYYFAHQDEFEGPGPTWQLSGTRNTRSRTPAWNA